MPRKWLLVVLTILVILSGVAATQYFPIDQYAALGSLFSAAGSLIAVIWFSASLYYQSVQLEEQRHQFSVQLKEQREQFAAEFAHLREDARRNALSFAREILRDAENSALKQNPEMKSINELSTAYALNMREVKIISESKDPRIVIGAAQKWFSTTEGPSMILLRGIKDAAETYFRAVGEAGIDYSREPEEFAHSYGERLWKLPYFSSYQGIASLVSEFMLGFKPGRKIVTLAFHVAMLKMSPPGVMKREEIVEDVRQQRQAGLLVPAIAEDF